MWRFDASTDLAIYNLAYLRVQSLQETRTVVHKVYNLMHFIYVIFYLIYILFYCILFVIILQSAIKIPLILFKSSIIALKLFQCSSIQGPPHKFDTF